MRSEGNKTNPVAEPRPQPGLHFSRSRMHGHRKKHPADQEEEGHVVSMVNESMVELQNPKFIADEMDQFENRLAGVGPQKGFCKVSRDKSLLLSNTQGYRKYKKQGLQAEKQSRQDKLNTVNTESPSIIKQEPITKQEGEQRQKSSESSSLSYSSDSRERRRKRLEQKTSAPVGQNLSGISIEVGPNPDAESERNKIQKHQSL